MLNEIHLFMQFVIGTVSSSSDILIIFASILSPELLLQSISLIYFNTWFVHINSNSKSKDFLYLSLINRMLG